MKLKVHNIHVASLSKSFTSDQSVNNKPRRSWGTSGNMDCTCAVRFRIKRFGSWYVIQCRSMCHSALTGYVVHGTSVYIHLRVFYFYIVSGIASTNISMYNLFMSAHSLLSCQTFSGQVFGISPEIRTPHFLQLLLQAQNVMRQQNIYCPSTVVHLPCLHHIPILFYLPCLLCLYNLHVSVTCF